MVKSNPPGDLSSDKSLSSPWGFMVEQDPIACKHTVSFPEVDHRPVCKKLCYTIGGSRIEWSGLLLWHFLNFAVKL